MTSQESTVARLVKSAPGDNASQSPPQTQEPSQSNTATRPNLPHAQTAPVSVNGVFDPSTQRSQQSDGSTRCSTTSSNATDRPAVPRTYTAHLPHNPERPPPHTYQRAHEFPPFPPLAQHPVLPFLTSAFVTPTFVNPPEISSAPPPPKRPSIAPRASVSQRYASSVVSTIPTMDVSKNDPTVFFIRAPLVVPRTRNADSHVDPAALNGAMIDGEPAPGSPLTYAILHTHRNWFLDPEDFRKDNPNRIDYPPELEPPRGWAPLSECTGAGAANRCKQAKEKQAKNASVKTKGSYAHGDNAMTDPTIEYGPSDDCHEKTVLRCTFCRREYHGPNAKSMWRRHVFDKHKVAMKNRREGSAGMAPKILSKKGKTKAAGPSAGPSNITPTQDSSVDLDAPAPTLDLTDEQNVIRLLERVVSGNLDISLPVSLLNPSSSSHTAPGLNLEAIALALQKSGISLAVEGGALSKSQPIISLSCGNEDSTELNPGQAYKSWKVDEQREGGEQDTRTEKAASTLLGVPDDSDGAISLAGVVNDIPDDARPSEVDDSMSELSDSAAPDILSRTTGQKRKADEVNRGVRMFSSTSLNRTPLKDNTALDRNNHNLTAPGTPRRDKGKQRALPSTPKMSHGSESPSSPPPRNPYTPLRHPSATALRSRALATTGEESYLTFIVSSPAAESPIRGAGRVSFTSPFRHRASPMKRGDRNGPPASDDVIGGLGTSSPRYPFEFNIQGTPTSPSYMSEFEPIPLEMSAMAWTPPSLGPPAPVSEPASRSLSRASSVVDDIDVDGTTDDEDRDIELQYPEWSSPLERVQYHRSEARIRDEDFDMDAFLDLQDAGPASDPQSPQKIIVSRGFSKEYGLLSPEEVERITASAHPSFEEEARSSKRRRVEAMA